MSAVSTAGQLFRLLIPSLRPDIVLKRGGIFGGTKTSRGEDGGGEVRFFDGCTSCLVVAFCGDWAITCAGSWVRLHKIRAIVSIDFILTDFTKFLQFLLMAIFVIVIEPNGDRNTPDPPTF